MIVNYMSLVQILVKIIIIIRIQNIKEISMTIITTAIIIILIATTIIITKTKTIPINIITITTIITITNIILLTVPIKT